MKDRSATFSTPSQRTPWAAVLILIGAGVVASFQVGKAPPVLTEMRGEFGMSLVLAGWILSAFNIIGLALGAFSGAVADALGHRRLLILGLVTQAAASLAGALSRHVWLLLFTRILEGLGFLVVAVSGPALIYRHAQARDLRLALSAWSGYVPAGMSAVMLIAPLITGPFGWRGLWVFNALLLGGYALLARAFIPRASRPGAPAPGILSRIFRDLLRTSTSLGPVLLALTFSTYTLQWLAVMGFLPTLLVEEYGLGAGLASILTALVVAVNVPGNLAGGWLMGRDAGSRADQGPRGHHQRAAHAGLPAGPDGGSSRPRPSDLQGRGMARRTLAPLRFRRTRDSPLLLARLPGTSPLISSAAGSSPVHSLSPSAQNPILGRVDRSKDSTFVRLCR